MERRVDISNYIYVVVMLLMFLCGTLIAQENNFKKQLNKTFKSLHFMQPQTVEHLYQTRIYIQF